MWPKLTSRDLLPAQLACKVIAERIRVADFDGNRDHSYLIPCLKHRRRAAGLTQTQAADAIGCQRVSLAFWEQGRQWPSSVWLPRIAAAYGCSMEELFLPSDDGSEGETYEQG